MARAPCGGIGPFHHQMKGCGTARAPRSLMRRSPELETSLTKAQLDVWLAHELFADPSVLNVSFAVEVQAPLDPDALTAALQTLVASADVLRMRIVVENGAPQMRILEQEDVSCEVVDLSYTDDDAANEWMRNRSRQPFALHGRLWNAALLRLGNARSIVYVNQHHISTDIWSQRLLAKRWGELYEQAIAGRLPERVALRQYADYARFARDLRDSAEYLCAKQFWRERLATPPVAPLLYGRSAHSGAAAAVRVTRRLGAARSDAVGRLAEMLGARSINRSRVAVLASLFAVLQYRVSGAEEIWIGVPYHNRPTAFRDAAGLFVNVVPLRIALSGEESFDALLSRVAADLDLALAHGQVPISQSMSAPVYHSSLNYHVRASDRFAGAPAKQTIIFSRRADEPLGLMVERDPASGEFIASFDCDKEMFAPPRDAQVVEHFLAVLDACTADPAAPIDAAEIVTPEERRLILSWAGRDRRTPSSASAGLLDGILERTRETPDAPAILDGALSVSYAELRSRAASLASVLMDRGVGRDRAVGVMIPRSADALCAMVAVLWAGGTYVPIDPAWPHVRVAFIARDLDLACIITRAGDVADGRQPIAGVPAIDITGVGAFAEEARPARRDAQQLAYIIYTSGSTGEPKGVGISDGALVSHCHSVIEFLGLTAADRVVQFHALTFDASIEEIFPPWLAGAAVVVRPADAFDPIGFNDFLSNAGATVVELPTSFWHEWVHALAATGRAVPPSVRFAFVGGEQPSTTALRDWWRVAPTARWANGYGPTETTVTSTAIEPAAGEVPDPIPMGRPLATETAYVLDRWRHLVPVGVPGELYIGGAGVARGYVNRPELTAERFIDDEMLDDRVYRTGDLARYRDDGLLEFLGRRDGQVKVRGYRIELAEIEHALTRHPAVSNAAALARDEDGRKRIVAYYVPKTPVTDEELREFLRTAIPQYMIPSAFVGLERLPLTVNGKVDKAALRSMAAPQAGSPKQAALTFNPVQAELIGIWERLLNVRGITPDDSFIALGGDSLLAARIISDIEQLFGRRLPLATMFPDATVARLTLALRQAAGETFARPVMVLNDGGRRTPLIYFHGDYGGGGLYATRLAQMLGPDQPLVVVHPFGVDGPEVPPTFEDMARRRLDGVLAACASPEYFVGGFCNGGLVALEMARLLGRRGIRVRGLALIDSVLNTRRFRPLGALVGAWSRFAGDSAYRARERFLTWRDRQQAIVDLLGLLGGRRERFESVADRLRFVTGSVARKFSTRERLPDAPARTAAPAQRAPDPGVDIVRPQDLWEAYERVMDAYVPARYDAPDVPVILLASEETAHLGMREEWSRVVSDVRLVPLPGKHYACVTVHLPVVARVLSELMAEGRDEPGRPAFNPGVLQTHPSPR